MSNNTKPAIVFCHGLWADGSCFSKVIPTLQADGHEVIAVQYGLNSYADDVETVKRTLGRVNSPAILVGHSYGGATITGAGTDERVVGLVYIAAVVPDVHETVQSELNKYPTEIFSHVNGTLNLTRVCRYRHFEADPSASSLCPRSREQCGQMFSSLSFALLGRAMMPARRLSLSL